MKSIIATLAGVALVATIIAVCVVPIATRSKTAGQAAYDQQTDINTGITTAGTAMTN